VQALLRILGAVLAKPPRNYAGTIVHSAWTLMFIRLIAVPMTNCFSISG
jgi:hypothetical protein